MTKTIALTGLLGALAFPSVASASDETFRYPDAAEIEEALPIGDSLTGREIYERFLENRHRKSIQQMRVVSMDPGGGAQTTVFTVALEETRDENDNPTNGVLANMLIEISAPFDMRNTSYLFIWRCGDPVGTTYRTRA